MAGGDWSSGYEVDFSYAANPPVATGHVGPVVYPRISTSAATRPTKPQPGPSRLHVILLVDDTNKDAGPANKAGAALLERTIRAGIADNRLGAIETVSGPDLTPDRIKARILALGVRPQDTVMGFYTGAAEYDDATRSYMLTPNRGSRFRRSDLKDWLVERGAALTVLLTDAPAYRVIPEMLPPLQFPTGAYSVQRLMFDNHGIVDLHAAAATETAFPRDSEGGLFTLAVVDYLRGLKPDGPAPTWPALLDRVGKTTDQMYVDYRRAVLKSNKVSADDKRVYREQAHQTPTALTPIDKVKPVPPPATKVQANSEAAEIVVRVPDKTRLFIEDRPTHLQGTVRHFVTARLQPGRAYTYSIRAELDLGGRALKQTKRVSVKAGETVTVRFDWPD